MKSILEFCRNFFFVIIVIYSGSSFAAINDGESFTSATRFINDGKYLEAIGVYGDIVEDSPSKNSQARALLFSGTIYDIYLDQPETALNSFNEVFSKYPASQASPDALFNSGRILYKMDKYKEAHEIYQKYIEKYPDSMRRNSAEIWARKAKEKISSKTQKVVTKTVAGAFDTEIRVLLKKKSGRLIFNSPSKIRLTDFVTGKTMFYGNGPVVITNNKKQIVVNTEKTSAGICKIETDNLYISIGGKRYRGSFVAHAKTSGISVVNHLHIEEYLYGVVPKEMSWLWSYEALMTQAIASRTYALYIKARQPSGRIYDLAATTASQVYGGYSAEKEQTNRAVDETAGKVLFYDGKLIIAYFHANSGGCTESSKNVWGADLPYLKSTSDQFSSVPIEKKWSLSLSYKKLGRLLESRNQKIGKIKKIKPEGRSKSGRIKSFIVYSTKGKTRLTGNHFRMKIGATSLKSTCFDTKKRKRHVVFEGRGYGHGVGMSQWGAHQMAMADYSCSEILKHYYKGVDIVGIEYN